MNQTALPGAAKKNKILVAISGRQDSAVTAALLKNQGYSVRGVFFENSGMSGFTSDCARPGSAKLAAEICAKIDIPLQTVDTSAVFESEVVDPFVHALLEFRAPTPCVNCTQQITFHHLFRTADQMGISEVATGHSAQIMRDQATGLSRIYRSNDSARDQSYLLFGLKQKELARLQMPMGGLPNNVIRKLALELELPTLDQSSRREQCLSADSDLLAASALVTRRTAHELRPDGIIRTRFGEVVGQHSGVQNHRVGERGLKINLKDAGEYAVLGYDFAKQGVILGPDSELSASEILVSRVNWLRPIRGMKMTAGAAKFSLGQPEIACAITRFDNDSIQLTLTTPVRAATAGQAVAVYEGEELIGGGFIDRVIPA